MPFQIFILPIRQCKYLAQALQWLDESVLQRQTLKDADIDVKSVELEDNSLLIRLNRADQQQYSKSIVKDLLGDDYVVAINLAQTTPEWLTSIGAHPMKLGLDLSGGVHFLLEVDTAKAVQLKMDIINTELRTALRKERLRYRTMPVREDGMRQMAFNDVASRDQAASLIKKTVPDLVVDSVMSGELPVVAFGYSAKAISDIEDYAVSQNLTTVRNRVNELGVAEPLVQRQGRNGIIVQLPGYKIRQKQNVFTGKTANLQFRLQALPNATKTSTSL